MAYKKTIVCLANSRKLGGRCVAGLEFTGNRLGSWIRPVSSAEKGELLAQRLYSDRSDPQLLDVIEMELLAPKATQYHPEDHLIQVGCPWVRRGIFPRAELEPATEKPLGCLWINGGSSSNGVNDVIPAPAAAQLGSSLKLIQPKDLVMTLHTEGALFGKPRRVVRGEFSFGRYDYVLSVTDSAIETRFRTAAEGAELSLPHPLLCLSVSEIIEKQNACYKLIAGVIP